MHDTAAWCLERPVDIPWKGLEGFYASGVADFHISDLDEFHAFELPALYLQNVNEQMEVLLLAWVLYLYRDETNRADISATWGLRSWDGKYSEDENTTTPLSDFHLEDTQLLSVALGTARGIYRRSVHDNSNYGIRLKSNFIPFGMSSLTKSDSTLPLFRIDIFVSDRFLFVRESHNSTTKLGHMAEIVISKFVDILNSVLSNQHQQVAQTIQIGQNELTKLWQWNGSVPPTIDRCMHDTISEVAQKRPDRPAVVSWDGELSYRELDLLSTKLACHLSAIGVGVGVTVPLLFEKSMWTSVAVLAVMKAGGAFILTDTSQPEARLQVIASEVSAQIILTSDIQTERGSRIAPDATVVVVGRSLIKCDDMESLPLPPVPASATLYVIFTSGSTGKPKGVVISHENYTSGALPRADAVGYRAHSRVLDFASYAFDVSIDCMLATLSQGGCICVPSEEARINDINGSIINMNVNMAHMTPSVARILRPEVMATLEVLGLGGESVSGGDVTVWGQNTKVIIAYGPSECTVGCTINNEVGAGRAYTSIGRGVGGNTWIVDPADHNRLMPIGEVGELLIEGPVVGVGYLNDSKSTSRVFIEDPLWLLDGTNKRLGRRGRLYMTGDLVKYDSDGSGSIVFVGRKDRQVKLRGQRVEPAEVEYHLRENLPAGVSIVVEVVTPKGENSEPTLVAFLAEKRTQKCTTEEQIVHFSDDLRQALAVVDSALAAELPVYMIPSGYISLAEIPLLVSCKTDRKRLHEIGKGVSKQQLAKFKNSIKEKQEPTSSSELKMKHAWMQLFGSDTDIGMHDDFFALGGNSLKAMRLVSIARDQGLVLSVADVFTWQTLTRIAQAAIEFDNTPQIAIPEFLLLGAEWREEEARTEVAHLCNLNPTDVEDVYPCTPMQEGLMALSAKVSEAYIAQRVVELKDVAIAFRLQDAFNAVISKSLIMRTRIVQIPGRGLMQVVVKQKIMWHSSQNLKEYLDLDNEDPMKLGDALVRFAIVRDDKENRIHMALTMHHAVYDGWSISLLIDRVNRAYRCEPPASLLPFRNFIQYLCSADREVMEEYWLDQLAGANIKQFPTLPRPGYQTSADSLLERDVTFLKPPASSSTIANAIRAGWAILASQYIASDDVVFGETLTGRSAPVAGIEQIEGPTITTVPVRVRVNQAATAAEFLKKIQEQTVIRMSHEHMGLQHIRRLSPEAREACELRMGLVLHPYDDEEREDGLKGEDQPANGFAPADDADAAREALKFNSYALMLVCSLRPDGFLIMASFDSGTISVPHMERVLQRLEITVQKLCADKDMLIGDIIHITEDQWTDFVGLSECGAQNVAASSQDVLRDVCREVDNNRLLVATEKQQTLLYLWRSVLELAKEEIITPDENFFDLGGDSISAMKLVSEARMEGYKLTIAQIFNNRSFNEMDNIIELLEPPQVTPKTWGPFSLLDCADLEVFIRDTVRPMLAESHWEIIDVLPARPLQAIAVQGTVNLPRYSVRYELFHFDTTVNWSRLFKSCQELVSRNEILRTVFVRHGEHYFSVVLRDLRVQIAEYEIDGDIRSFAQALCGLDVQTTSPLGSSLVKFLSVKCTNGQACLILRISHAQYDEISLPTMLNELSALYEGRDVAQTVPFSKYVHQVVLKNIPQSVQYWRELLRGSTMTVLQPDIPLTSKIMTDVSRTFDISSRSKQITIATLPTAAWALYLARRLSLRDVTFGEVVSGRNIDLPDCGNVVGPCWQYIPVRVEFSPCWTVRDLLRAVQSQHIASASFEGIGLSEIHSQCTDWPASVNWFDSVVHQDVAHVEQLHFTSVKSHMQTVYPHAEPLREWKIQAFVNGEQLRIEIVTFESWLGSAKVMLEDIGRIFAELLGDPTSLLFQEDVQAI